MEKAHETPHGLSEDFLANDFYCFLRDPSKGCGYRASKPSSTRVRYPLANYQIEVNFTGSYHCQLEVKDVGRESSGVEELVGVPYDGKSHNCPNWPKFFDGIIILIKERLANSK